MLLNTITLAAWISRMPTQVIDERTRREWRELGFFYDLDSEIKEWRIVGSRAGIGKFAELLIRYAEDPRNAQLSEHEHYGPYAYLKIMTWSDAGVSADSIHGPTDDLRRLGEVIRARASSCGPGTRIRISDEYASRTDYAVILEFRPDDFDPASDDPLLSGAG